MLPVEVVCHKSVTQEHANEEMRKWATDAFDKARPGVYKHKSKEQYLELEG